MKILGICAGILFSAAAFANDIDVELTSLKKLPNGWIELVYNVSDSPRSWSPNPKVTQERVHDDDGLTTLMMLNYILTQKVAAPSYTDRQKNWEEKYKNEIIEGWSLVEETVFHALDLLVAECKRNDDDRAKEEQKDAEAIIEKLKNIPSAPTYEILSQTIGAHIEKHGESHACYNADSVNEMFSLSELAGGAFTRRDAKLPPTTWCRSSADFKCDLKKIFAKSSGQ